MSRKKSPTHKFSPTAWVRCWVRCVCHRAGAQRQKHHHRTACSSSCHHHRTVRSCSLFSTPPMTDARRGRKRKHKQGGIHLGLFFPVDTRRRVGVFHHGKLCVKSCFSWNTRRRVPVFYHGKLFAKSFAGPLGDDFTSSIVEKRVGNSY